MADGHLAAERDVAQDTIRAIQLTVPWAFETSPADSDDPQQAALREVKRCDIFVLIVGNRHSPAVQAELDVAHDNGKPILAFVERLPETDESEGRSAVLRQLMPRHKFQRFASPDELRRELRDGIISELIRGYRDRFRPRVSEADIEILLKVSADAIDESPSLVVRQARHDDKSQVKSQLLELKRWYPSISQWIPDVLKALNSNENLQVRVADLDGVIRGISVARDKGDGARKFSTIYVSPDSQGAAIGPHLVREEVKRAAADGVRKAYVTFAGEIAPRIRPVLAQSGFSVEGIAPARYRPSSGEFIMGKIFAHEAVDHENFIDFIRRYCVLDIGGTITSSQGTSLIAKLPMISPLAGIEYQDVQIIASISSTPEREYEQLRVSSHDHDWMFFSLFGKPARTDHRIGDALNWVDGADLAMRYFPVNLKTPEQDAIIVTILPSYADALIPKASTPSFLPPSRLQIRPDNVYYRTANRYDTLRRGTRVFFYVSEPERAIRGSAIITSITIDTPEECFARYGRKGILRYADLVKMAGRSTSNEVLAIAFDWYVEYPRSIKLDQIQEINTSYNPITASVVSGTVARQIHERGFHG